MSLDGWQHSDDFSHAFVAAFFRLEIVIDCACRVVRSSGGDANRPREVAAAIRAAFEWAAAKPDLARVLTVESFAAGPVGVACHHRLLDSLAYHLSAGRELVPAGAELSMVTERALAAGLCSLVARHLDSGRAGELPALAPEAIEFALSPYLGPAAARRLARSSTLPE